MAASYNSQILEPPVSYSSLVSNESVAEDDSYQLLEPILEGIGKNTKAAHPDSRSIIQSPTSCQSLFVAIPGDTTMNTMAKEPLLMTMDNPSPELYEASIWNQLSPVNFLQFKELERRETADSNVGLKSVLGQVDDGQPQATCEVEKARFFKSDWLAPWVPKADVNRPEAYTWRSKRSTTLIICSLMSATILILNLIATILFKRRWDASTDLGSLYRGNCSNAHRLSMGLHIIINALSTLLLSASNLCMQLLVAPTRSEVDESHRKCQPLDIGVPSLRNLKAIGWKRRIPWFLLAISSVPLHFLYNSAIVPTLAVNSFVYLTVSPEFINGGSWNTSATMATILSLPSPLNHTVGMLREWEDTTLDLQRTIHQIQNRLSDQETYVFIDKWTCLLEYSNLFGNRSDVIMVSNSAKSPDKNSLLAYGLSQGATREVGWALCWNSNTFDCDKLNISNFPGGETERARATSNWNIAGYKIDYCLSSQKSTEEHCSVDYSFSIMLAVCLCNAMKCCCIWYTSYIYTRIEELSLSIFGDAVASFLSRPDETTQHLSAISQSRISQHSFSWQNSSHRRWERTTVRWMKAVSTTRWALCLSLCGLLLIATSIIVVYAIKTLRVFDINTSLKAIIDLGFGAVNAMSFANGIGPKSTEFSINKLYSNILFANCWQFCVSLIYIAYNAVLTSMLVVAEWDTFAEKWKTLRVSPPVGLQRASFFISMPLRYGLPLMVSISIFHWSISQSVFIVSLNRFFSNGEEDIRNRTITIGFSIYAILISMMIGLILVLALCLLSLKKYRNGVPQDATNSARISAACHPPDEDTQAHLFWVRWGTVQNGEGIDRCSFTTASNVSKLEPGRLYF